MGPFILTNTFFAGFFAFAALHYAWQWLLSRRETALIVFSLHCVLCGIVCCAMVGIGGATSIGMMNAALSWRTFAGALGTATTVWLISRLAGIQARWYVNSIIVLAVSSATGEALIGPINGTASAINQLDMPWGETISYPVREPAGWWLAPLLALVLSVDVFGLLSALRLGFRDRGGAILLGLASAGGLSAGLVALQADLQQKPMPYLGDVPYAFWVALMSLMLSREYAKRGQRLATAEPRFRAIFDQTFQFIGLLSTDGKMIESNRTALKFAGIKEEDVLGRHFWDTPWWSHSPVQQQKLRQAIASAAKGEFVRFEATHPAVDGKLHYVDFSLKPVRDESGQVTLLIPEGRDITDVKESEMALEHSEATLGTLINSIPEPAYLTDAAGIILVANEAMAQRVGLTVKEIIGQDIFTFLADEVVGGAKSWLKQMLLTQKPLVREGIFRGRIYMNYMSPVIDASGSVARIAILAVDITERKQAEDTLRQTVSSLAVPTGRKFLTDLPASLARDCQVEFALIGVFDSRDPAKVHTIGAVRGGMPQADFDYDFADTPCEQVVRRGFCHYPTAVQQEFPRDALLTQMGVDSYMGTPLLSGTGTPLGVILLMHSAPIPQPERAQSLLRAVAGRASAELEREQTESALRESEARYRTLVEYAPEAIVVLDVNKQAFIEANSNACRQFHMSREQLLQLSPLSLSPERQANGQLSSEIRQQYLQKALDGDTPRFEWINVIEGREIPCEISLVRLPSATQELIRVSYTDISERKEAEKLIRKKDLELRRLVDSNLVGIVFWEDQGKFADVNDYFLQLVGYTREEFFEGRLDTTVITPPEYLPLHDKALAEMAETGVCVPFEKEYVRKNGSRVPVLVGATRFAKDSPRGVAYVLDLTQRKQLETQVQQAQKMEAIGHLAGGLAHDFNNILTVVNGRCDMLLYKGGLDPKARQSVQEIRDAGIRAASLTRQLLAFSRQQILMPRVLNLNTVVTETQQMLHRLIGEDLALTAKLDPNLASVKADRGQIEQVLMNLCVNARDAMPKGGSITIETNNAVLNAAYCRAFADLQPGPYVKLRVADTGTGMDEQTQAKIFEPFFTTKGPGKGTGLGLATVHGIIKQSRGHIEVESQLGCGTTFNIYLPQIDPETELKAPKSDLRTQLTPVL